MRYRIKRSASFKRDFKKIKHNHKIVEELKYIIMLLSEGKKLPEKYRDHGLKGPYIGMRDCHITPDCILIYEIQRDELVLTLIRLGSHSHLF